MCCLPVLFVLNWTGVLFAVPPLRSTVTHFRDTGFTFVQKLCFCNVKCQLVDRRSFVLIVEILDSHSHFENIDSSCVVDFQKYHKCLAFSLLAVSRCVDSLKCVLRK